MEVYMTGDTATMNCPQIILPQYLERIVVVAPDAFSQEAMKVPAKKVTILGTNSAPDSRLDIASHGVREHSGLRWWQRTT